MTCGLAAPGLSFNQLSASLDLHIGPTGCLQVLGVRVLHGVQTLRHQARGVDRCSAAHLGDEAHLVQGLDLRAAVDAKIRQNGQAQQG